MPRKAFTNAAGVLKAHGFIAANEPGDSVVDVADDFALEPGRWRWNGTAWVAFTPPPDRRNQDRTDADAKLAALPAGNVKEALQALRKLMGE